MENEKELLHKALATFGMDSQLDMAIEECSELIVAIQHYKRNRVSWDSVAEELADVQLMTVQLRTFDPGMFDYFREIKLDRLKDLIKTSGNNQAQTVERVTPG